MICHCLDEESSVRAVPVQEHGGANGLCPLSSVVKSVRFTPDERKFDSFSGYSQTGRGIATRRALNPKIVGAEPTPSIISPCPNGQVAVCNTAYVSSNLTGESQGQG